MAYSDVVVYTAWQVQSEMLDQSARDVVDHAMERDGDPEDYLDELAEIYSLKENRIQERLAEWALGQDDDARLGFDMRGRLVTAVFRGERPKRNLFRGDWIGDLDKIAAEKIRSHGLPFD